MAAMKLTVGIPTYNRSGLLRQAIESVLAQTYTDFRLIVSDNASHDDTPDVVRSFDDGRIEYARSETNIGAIGNFNRLIELAESEFLILLPDDDVLYPDHLRTAVEVLERSQRIGLVHTAFDVIDVQSRVTQTVRPVASRAPVKIERQDRALERLMVSAWGICFSSVVYRTKAIADAGGLREDEEPFGDRALWMRIALGWDFGYVSRPLIGFRPHGDTITRSIALEQGLAPDDREFLLYSRINFDRRTDFLDGASLPSRRRGWLRGLAGLQFLIENAAWGLPSRDVATRLVELIRTEPRLLGRPALWRLIAAQLGGRRVRAALRRMRPGTVTE